MSGKASKFPTGSNQSPVWVALIDGQPTGPLTIAVLQRMLKAGQLKQSDLVRLHNQEAWITADEALATFQPKEPHNYRGILVAMGIAMLVLIGLLAPQSSSTSDDSKDTETVETDQSDPADDDETFMEYATRKTQFQPDEQTAIIFALSQEGLLNKKLKDRPRRAEKLRMELGE